MAGSGSAHLRPDALLRVEDLVVEFTSRRGTVQAVSGVSFDVLPGETLGIVGESGCGKSTTARAVVRLVDATSGSIRLGGRELGELTGEELRTARTGLQMVFQDPVSSLNPRHRVGAIVEAPLRAWGDEDAAARRRIVDDVLTAVGLDPATARDRRPRELSGGQCQRVSIARALVTRPQVLVCDEAVSALDASVQAQILNLLESLRAEYGLTIVFISHDLSVVRHVSDRVMVMYLGKVCEVGPAEELFDAPRHPYTKALIDSIPGVETVGERLTMQGEIPSPLAPPTGCRCRTRCPFATELCVTDEPTLVELTPGRAVACHYPLAVAGAAVDVSASDA